VLTSIRNIIKVPDLRNKILFTVFILVVYRLGSYWPVPGVDQNAVATMKETAREGGVLQYLSLFAGRALTQFALFALGIMPYITSSIIMQILTVVIPKLQQWQEQGAVGQRKITQWTRYLTIALSVLQSTGLVYSYHNGAFGADVDLIPHYGPFRVFLVVLTFTAGTAMLMWMGEAITQRGIGNGMSLIIFASVVSQLPGTGSQIKAEGGWGGLTFVIAMVLVMIVFVVFIEQGQRRIPVQFAKRIVGRKQYGGQNTYIPLKVNQSGVIPIIFANAVLNIPLLLVQVIPSDKDWGRSITDFVDSVFRQSTHPLYLTVYGLLIIGFAYFYTAIAFDPVQQADNLRKQGGFIPGIRPGPQTERYLSRTLNRITLPGAIFIAVLALLPAIAISIVVGGGSNSSLANNFGGTTILIAVGVALETMKQIDGQLMMRNYSGLLSAE
jgi:preprotein translocase subunit SecY